LGTTLTNIHVFVEETTDQDAHQEIVSILEACMHQQSFQSVTSESSDRSLRIVSVPGTPWISVYETGGRLLSLPGELSQVGYPLIELDVFDSDVLQMRLFQSGREIDVYSDWQNYDEDPRHHIGDVDIWSMALSCVPSSAELQLAWTHQESDYPFQSEGALYRVIDLLKIERWSLWVGKTLEKLPDSAQVTELHFRYGQDLPYDLKSTGLPAFRINPYQGPVQQTRLGINFDLLFSVTNLGGQGVGVQFEISGSALDTQLVELVGVFTEFPIDERVHMPVILEKQTGPHGNTIYRFDFKTHEIPAGLANWQAVYDLTYHLRNFQKEFHLQDQGGRFGILINPLQIGAGQIITQIAPMENPTAFAAFTTDIDVSYLPY
jgi:hypothetical protein